MGRNGTHDSYERTRKRFDKPSAAAKYATRFQHSRRHAHEERCIHDTLASLPRDASVLDLPCGTGRLTKGLVCCGFRVTGADNSSHMIAVARQQHGPHVTFDVQDVLATTYTDRQFDAVICNRLFHHFLEPQTRILALAELGRISAGPVVVSFFNRMSLGALRIYVSRKLLRRKPNDRSLMTESEMGLEGLAAGLVLDRVWWTRGRISPQCYARFVHLAGAGPPLDHGPLRFSRDVPLPAVAAECSLAAA
jgi:2-polyprenyl-3-methyl-5-hydroxy-6-metoxy-1,4-benzoquinol methylase